MAINTFSFPVSPESDASNYIFGLRAVATDYLRRIFREKIDAAEDASIDKMTAVTKVTLTLAKAASKSRLFRAVPIALVKWASYVEYNASQDGFPTATNNTIGTFERSAISEMANHFKLIKLGGLIFVGSATRNFPEDIIEIRVQRFESDGTYMATIVYGRPDDGSNTLIFDPVEPEGVDA